METILVSEVVAKDGKMPWKIYDGNGIEYVTWDDGIGHSALELKGEQATVKVKVTEKQSRSGGTFTNRLLEEISKPPPEVERASAGEPSVNFGKQVVIIRQNAWAQTNAIYDKAVALYKLIQTEGPEGPVLDIEAVHAIAWQLYSANKRPAQSNMQYIAADIEKVVRSHWFPLEGEEIPF